MEVLGFSKKSIKSSNLVEFRLHSRFVLGRWRYSDIFCNFLSYFVVSHRVATGGLLKLFHGQWERELPLI